MGMSGIRQKGAIDLFAELGAVFAKLWSKAVARG
jgi:hypothetical protein